MKLNINSMKATAIFTLNLYTQYNINVMYTVKRKLFGKSNSFIPIITILSYNINNMSIPSIFNFRPCMAERPITIVNSSAILLIMFIINAGINNPYFLFSVLTILLKCFIPHIHTIALADSFCK